MSTVHGVIHTYIVCVYEFRRGFCTSVLSFPIGHCPVTVSSMQTEVTLCRFPEKSKPSASDHHVSVFVMTSLVQT